METQQRETLLDTPVAITLDERKDSWLGNKLYSLRPADRKAPLSLMRYGENGSKYVISKKTNITYTFMDRGFTQFLKLLHPNLSKLMVDQLSEKSRVNLINDLIKRNLQGHASKRENVLFRCKPTGDKTKVFASFSDTYTPVNHYDLYKIIGDLVRKVPDKIKDKISLSASLDKMYLRMPLGKVVDYGKGIYSGIEFSNSQAGSAVVAIISMLWELICSNGMISMIDESVFMRRKHVGNMNHMIGGFGDWYLNEQGILVKYFEQLSKYKIPDVGQYDDDGAVVRGKYTDSMQWLKDAGGSNEFLELVVINNIKQRDKEDAITGWDFVRNITYVSQKFPNQRYTIDRWAGLLVKELWGIN